MNVSEILLHERPALLDLYHHHDEVPTALPRLGVVIKTRTLRPPPQIINTLILKHKMV
jgi:hypothetical protein